MGQKNFLDSIYQSMQDSAREVRLSLGRPTSHATRQQALQQVAMLKAARMAQPNAIDLFLQQRRAAEAKLEPEMTLDEINAEIRAAREERRNKQQNV